jgi:hypothetical protein
MKYKYKWADNIFTLNRKLCILGICINSENSTMINLNTNINISSSITIKKNYIYIYIYII